MQGYQKLSFIGNMGKDPETRPAGDTTVTSFSVGVSDWRMKDGEDVHTEWFNVEVWGKQGEFIEKHGAKGSPIFVEGKLKTRSWQDKETGETKYFTAVRADETRLGYRGEAQPSREPAPARPAPRDPNEPSF
jgi:single-strand DNA-binding protein